MCVLLAKMMLQTSCISSKKSWLYLKYLWDAGPFAFTNWNTGKYWSKQKYRGWLPWEFHPQPLIDDATFNVLWPIGLQRGASVQVQTLWKKGSADISCVSRSLKVQCHACPFRHYRWIDRAGALAKFTHTDVYTLLVCGTGNQSISAMFFKYITKEIVVIRHT